MSKGLNKNEPLSTLTDSFQACYKLKYYFISVAGLLILGSQSLSTDDGYTDVKNC
jgi:hypothetical protein